jgi:hypothetical protein
MTDLVTMGLVGAGAGLGSAVLGWFGLGLSYERRIATLEADNKSLHEDLQGALQEAAEARNDVKDVHDRVTAAAAADVLRAERADDKFRAALKEAEERLSRGQIQSETRVTSAVNALAGRLDSWMGRRSSSDG